MIRNVAAIIFNVSDLDKACDFYINTLNLKLTYKSIKTGWAEFDINGVKLSLNNSKPYGEGNNPLVSLYVENLEQMIDSLKEKGVIFTGTGEIEAEFYGNTINMKDLDGNIINLYEKQY